MVCSWGEENSFSWMLMNLRNVFSTLQHCIMLGILDVIQLWSSNKKKIKKDTALSEKHGLPRMFIRENNNNNKFSSEVSCQSSIL